MLEGFQAKWMTLLNNLVNSKEAAELDFLGHYFAQTSQISLNI